MSSPHSQEGTLQLGNILIRPLQKKNSELSHVQREQQRPCSGIVKSSCYVNFSQQKQQTTATDNAKLSKKLLEATEGKEKDD
jgi:hypothetical protein